MIDWPHLEAWHQLRGPGFDWPDPFPHTIYRDGYALLSEDVARDVALAMPLPVYGGMTAQHHLHSRKYSQRTNLPGPIAELIADLNSPRFLAWLERETGITGLVADPELFGGGIHVSGPHGFLDVHADFMRHPTTGMQRILNLLIYLTPDWQRAWGGGLELWDKDMRMVRAFVPCAFNTAVLFECSATSYHGVQAVTCPKGVQRASIALYFYRPWPAEFSGPILRTTDYRPRPWEWKKRARRAITRVIGPAGRSALRRLAGR